MPKKPRKPKPGTPRTTQQPRKKPAEEFTPPPGYRLKDGHPFVFEPEWDTPHKQYPRLVAELWNRIQWRGLPTPAWYAAWYGKHGVDALIRARAPEVPRCKVCREKLVDKTGSITMNRRKVYCSDRCRKGASSRRYRKAHPEGKMLADYKYLHSIKDDLA